MDKNIKKVSEDMIGGSKREFKVKDDDLKDVAAQLDPQLKTGDVINITSEGTNEGVSPNTQEAFFAGLRIGNGTHEGTFTGDLSLNKIALRAWQEYNASLSSELNGLYGDEEKGERGNDYDVHVRENFNTLIKNLKAKTKIIENINPRIKKSDLIDYLKNKK